MELQLSDSFELILDSRCEFELPFYITKLNPAELNVESPKEELIIAAGTDPRDGKITVITAAGKICVFDANKYHIPRGPSVPSHGGLKIFLKNIEGRWPGDSPGFYIKSNWVLKNSESALKGATLHTNYKYENGVK